MKCKDCDFCKQIYHNLWYSFWFNKEYYCILHDRLTEPKNGCLNGKKKEKEYNLSAERLKQAEEDIKALIKLLKDATQ